MPLLPENIKAEAKEYTVERLSELNLDDVAKLHSAVYGVPAPLEHYRKKYNTAYTGVEFVGFIAYRNNEPVAYYGVIPCFIKFNNEIILSAQSADTMTHPQHRYKGMFVELSLLTFDLCKKLGILLVFGFPNQNSYHGAINKLGWKMTGSMDAFIIPVKSIPLAGVARKVRFLQPIYKGYRHSALKKNIYPATGISNSVVADGFAGIYRNDEYFFYKTYRPSEVLRINVSKIWVSYKDIMMIGDMEGVTASNFEIVMDKLKSLAKKIGVKQIQFHCSPDTTLHRLFAEHYEPTPSYPMLFQDFGSSIAPEKIRFTFADLDIF